MKLLLDVHHSPRAAMRLRFRGCDVLAGADDPALAALDDEELLRTAARNERVIVAEHTRDFHRIVRTWGALSEHHAGIVFTSPRRYHRASKAYPDNLIHGLTALVDKPPRSTVDWVHWLEQLE